MSDTAFFIIFLLGFIILTYTIIVLFKRKEYENSRIYGGYNVMIFGIILLALSSLVKTVKFGFLSFNEDIILDYVLYLDIASNLVLIPLFVISFLVAMMFLREA